MGKLNRVINYQNLTVDLIELLNKKYPDGYQNHVIKVTTPKKDSFYGVTLDTSDTSYLIKVPVKIDTNPEEFDEKEFEEEETITPDENYSENSEDFENIPDEES